MDFLFVIPKSHLVPHSLQTISIGSTLFSIPLEKSNQGLFLCFGVSEQQYVYMTFCSSDIKGGFKIFFNHVSPSEIILSQTSTLRLMRLVPTPGFHPQVEQNMSVKGAANNMAVASAFG